MKIKNQKTHRIVIKVINQQEQKAQISLLRDIQSKIKRFNFGQKTQAVFPDFMIFYFWASMLWRKKKRLDFIRQILSTQPNFLRTWISFVTGLCPLDLTKTLRILFFKKFSKSKLKARFNNVVVANPGKVVLFRRGHYSTMFSILAS